MRTKLKKLLFEITKNSRITTKELGKQINSSQQSASYLLNQLKKKHFIEGATVLADSVKLGFINILVGFNFLTLESSVKKEIINELKETDEIIYLEEGKEGFDILTEFIASNLSSFNKIYFEIISKFNKNLRTEFIFPVIVKHEYFKNYLSRKFWDSDIILSGDRQIKKITKREILVLNELINFPNKRIINISESLKISPKQIIKLKKNLENKSIIKAYSSILNFNKLGIERKIIFLRFTGEKVKQIDKFAIYARSSKNIVEFIKIIGNYQAMIVIENLKEKEIINEIRSRFLIERYFLMKSSKIHKKKYICNLKKYYRLN